MIVALRNEKGSYNSTYQPYAKSLIVALRNEKGSYNEYNDVSNEYLIVALRNEKGSYNSDRWVLDNEQNCSTAK